MATVFEASEGVKVKVGDEIVEVEKLTVESLKRIAKEHGIKKFTATLNGEDLTVDDFPIESGEVIITPYYEAK